ncbi:hypothetical protein SAMN05421772_11515 [Paracoccus saliphilus]|uniref:Uncharacterized protein n=1 Tax=Paracoccus saliphilus TaxID=405559 RepID=A0AA45W713_9RHOB|nr:hypothetical protein SAMN05421772_11515 [Paracoccus saliphilus]
MEQDDRHSRPAVTHHANDLRLRVHQLQKRAEAEGFRASSSPLERKAFMDESWGEADETR